MKKVVFLLTVLAFLTLPLVASAQSMSCTNPWPVPNNNNKLYVIKCTCTYAADGTFSNQTTSVSNGFLSRVVLTPKTPAPSNGYTVNLKDFKGISLMGASMTGSSSSSTEYFPSCTAPDGATGVCDKPVHNGLRVDSENNSVASAVFEIRMYISRY